MKGSDRIAKNSDKTYERVLNYIAGTGPSISSHFDTSRIP